MGVTPRNQRKMETDKMPCTSSLDPISIQYLFPVYLIRFQAGQGGEMSYAPKRNESNGNDGDYRVAGVADPHTPGG